MRFIWFKKGGKYSSFYKHRQFLPLDHPFREDVKSFMKGVKVLQVHQETAPRQGQLKKGGADQGAVPLGRQIILIHFEI
jgi:hypothetical protein